MVPTKSEGSKDFIRSNWVAIYGGLGLTRTNSRVVNTKNRDLKMILFLAIQLTILGNAEIRVDLRF